MIIELQGAVLRLSGAIRKNEWPAIRSAAYLLLRSNPYGVVIECSGLGPITGDGAKSLLDAVRHVGASRAPFMLVSPPADVLAMLERSTDEATPLPIVFSMSRDAQR
jgi:anti-anti-sigma regulatory factor